MDKKQTGTIRRAPREDRWEASRRLMEGKSDVKEFRLNEPIYQTDFEDALRKIAQEKKRNR